jgi:Zn finger protein HypA/HybF involved in hydrogenase expression
LIEKGANVNAADVEGNTPLIAAAEKDDVATLRLLLQHGVDLGHANAKGWTALDRAVAYLRRTIAHELVRAGAPLDDEQRRQQRNFHFARQAAGWFPVILVGSLLLAAWMGERFKRLPKRTAPPRMGDDLPRLRELKCNACGGSASLRPGTAVCSHCHEPVPVPEDYTATLKLRAMTVRLMEKAVHLWKRVRIVSAAPMRWLLWGVSAWFIWLMAKGLFSRFVREALYDLMTFRGTMAWALGVLTMAAIPIALCGYALYLLVVRNRLPAMPVIGKNVGEAETANCPNCGAIVEMKPGDLVGVCGYCGGETYRVALARRARGIATSEKDDATLSLYQAMVDVYELRKNAAMAVPMAMVVIGIGLVVLLRVALLFL